MNYIIISSTYNDADYIKRTIESVLSQTIHPLQWIIVNDGSTDNTLEILQRYSQKHHWIKILNQEKTNAEFGVVSVVNFYNGLNSIDFNNWDFVIKLDTDLQIDKVDFFERQLIRMDQDNSIGICSGITYTLVNGKKVLNKTRPYWRTGGAMKLYRRKCFEDMCGLVPIYGWDGLDDYKAMFRGWKTRTFYDLHVNHLGKPRAITREKDVYMIERKAFSLYIRGYPFEFIILKGLSYLSKGISFTIAFYKSYLKEKRNRTKLVVSNEERIFIRRVQYIRLLELIIGKKML